MCLENSKKKKHNYRSTTICKELKYVGKCWKNCEKQTLPLFQVKDDDGKITPVKTLKHHFSLPVKELGSPVKKTQSLVASTPNVNHSCLPKFDIQLSPLDTPTSIREKPIRSVDFKLLEEKELKKKKELPTHFIKQH